MHKHAGLASGWLPLPIGILAELLKYFYDLPKVEEKTKTNSSQVHQGHKVLLKNSSTQLMVC